MSRMRWGGGIILVPIPSNNLFNINAGRSGWLDGYQVGQTGKYVDAPSGYPNAVIYNEMPVNDTDTYSWDFSGCGTDNQRLRIFNDDYVYTVGSSYMPTGTNRKFAKGTTKVLLLILDKNKITDSSKWMLNKGASLLPYEPFND